MLGEEEIDGENTCLYQYSFDLKVIMDKSFSPSSKKLPKNRVKIWINSNGLPMKVEYSGEVKGLKGAVISKSVEKFNFNEDVKFEVPKI